jgi:hypothetical protein
MNPAQKAAPAYENIQYRMFAMTIISTIAHAFMMAAKGRFYHASPV